MPAVQEFSARRDLEFDRPFHAAASDDALTGGSALDDGRVAAGLAERWLVSARRPAVNVDLHNVRVGRDGVFVAGGKVADLGQVVQVIARDDVAEIRGPVVARGSVLGGVLGGWWDSRSVWFPVLEARRKL